MTDPMSTMTAPKVKREVKIPWFMRESKACWKLKIIPNSPPKFINPQMKERKKPHHLYVLVS